MENIYNKVDFIHGLQQDASLLEIFLYLSQFLHKINDANIPDNQKEDLPGNKQLRIAQYISLQFVFAVSMVIS